MLDLPSRVLPAWLVTLAAGYRPLGDETEMRCLGTTWRDAQHALEELADEQAAQCRTRTAEGIPGVATGLTGIAIAANLAASEQGLRDLAEYAGSLADQLFDGANIIEFQKLTVDITLWAVALQVAYAVVLPHGALLTLAARVWAQKRLQSALLRSMARLLLDGAEYVGKRPLLAVPLQGGSSGAIEGAGTDWLAQRIQIRDGHRETVDRDSIWVSTASGVAGGMAGDAGARWVSPAVGRISAPVSQLVGAPAGRAIHVVVLGAAGGFFGAPAGMAAAVLAAGGDRRELTAEDWGEALITGAGGGVIGAAGYALRSTTTPLPVPSSEPDPIPKRPTPIPGKPDNATKEATKSETPQTREHHVTQARARISAPPNTTTTAPPPQPQQPVPASPWTRTADTPAGGNHHSPTATTTTHTDDDSPRTPDAESGTGAAAQRTPEHTQVGDTPRVAEPEQQADQAARVTSAVSESALPLSDSGQAELAGPAAGSESATREPSTVALAEPTDATHPAAEAATTEGVPARDDRIRPPAAEEPQRTELFGDRATGESTTPRVEAEQIEPATPTQGTETGDIGGLLPVPTPGSAVQRHVVGPTGLAPGGGPRPTGRTPTPDPHGTVPTSSPDEPRPKVGAPSDPDRRRTAGPGRVTISAAYDHAPAPPLPDPSAAPAENATEVEAVAAAETPPQSNPPDVPTRHHQSEAPDSGLGQSTRTRADTADEPPTPAPTEMTPTPWSDAKPAPARVIDRSSTTGPGINDVTNAAASAPKPHITPADTPLAPETGIPAASATRPAAHPFDVHARWKLDQQREQQFDAAEKMLFDTEQALRTLWSTPPTERQLAALTAPTLRADILRQRLDTLRDKGISPPHLNDLEAWVDRALDTHREITAVVRADAQHMQRILRVYATDPAAEPRWRTPGSPDPDPRYCFLDATAALEALFPDSGRRWPSPEDATENVRDAFWSTAWSHLMGAPAAHIRPGPDAHRKTVELLSDPHDAPMPGREPGAPRRVVVIHDAYSTDPDSADAHTYLAARLNNGALVRLDLNLDIGPRPLDSPGSDVLHRKVWALDRDGSVLTSPSTDPADHRRVPSPAGLPRGARSARPRDTPITADSRTSDHVGGPHINELSPTTRVEPAAAAYQDIGTEIRSGKLEPNTNVEAVPVSGGRTGLRGWFLRMATTPVGTLLSGSMIKNLGSNVAGTSAGMSVSIMTGSPVLASLVMAARDSARLIAILPASAVADRFDQRRVVVASSLVGIGAATLGVLAIGFSWLLAPVAVAAAMATALFVSTVADIFAITSQIRYANRYTEGGTDSEQKEVNRLSILVGQITRMIGEFLGPALTALHHGIPFAVRAVTDAVNLARLRKVRKEFGEPPELGEGGTERPQPGHTEQTPRVNETAPGTLVNKPHPDTRVTPAVADTAQQTDRNHTDPPAVDDSGNEQSATAADRTERDDQDTTRSPADEEPGEPSERRGWPGRVKDGVGSLFGAVWQDRYLRGMVLVETPISYVAMGIQTARLVDFMAALAGWQAGLLAVVTGFAGFGGALLANVALKKATVKSLEPLTMAAALVTTIPAAVLPSPFLLALSMLSTSALAAATYTKMGDYMHDVDKQNHGGMHLARMKGAETFMANAGMIPGVLAGGFVISAAGLATAGFAQVGVLAVATVLAGYYGIRYRRNTQAPVADQPEP